ncbi:ribosomal maturation YjgA family protein [Mucilaginibacter myungsuensis]|uniref:DUF2809 domain-containing protein n=1 Tax=Mucilaginibacter myungsuensis TaxID=649104 RepID=A0A929KZP2_9SPHI|nr:DUF2809 domain-containing protein [Mucilaginibacter myungsuensis]MBE9663572.1 DUF2809 domain-containing protein [Mucilaginibacter myungsuensis]MDN3599104.1 DUF2809 domain-containing protein [Mucilaginibacter myungsuensis]
MIFNVRYFLLAVLLFLTEVGIAVFFNDAFIRPLFGDYLVVMLVYMAIKSFVNKPPVITAIGTLLFAYAIEAAQYFGLVYKIGLGGYPLACTLIGTTFSWSDMLAYTLGVITIIIIETIRIQRSINKHYLNKNNHDHEHIR